MHPNCPFEAASIASCRGPVIFTYPVSRRYPFDEHPLALPTGNIGKRQLCTIALGDGVSSYRKTGTNISKHSNFSRFARTPELTCIRCIAGRLLERYDIGPYLAEATS